MDFIAAIQALVKEAKLLRNYKRMSKGIAILSFILTLPFVCSFLGVLAAYYVLVACYKLAAAPYEQVKKFVEDSGKDVKHATQFIIYYTAFPFVFLCQVVLAFASLGLHWLFLLANIYGYLATLGGTTFAPFLNNQPNREAAYSTEKFSKRRAFWYVGLALILIAASVLLLLIGGLLVLLGSLVGEGIWAVGSIVLAIAAVPAGLLSAYSIYQILYICLFFKKVPLEVEEA